MPKKSSKEVEFKNLIEIVANHPEGVSTDELFNLLEGTTPKRTLQYRLSALIKAGVLRNLGSGRSSKYSLSEVLDSRKNPKQALLPSKSFAIPLSRDAQKLQEQMRAPIQVRKHVSYRREFLASYEPNKTFYLTPTILKKLLTLGSGVEKGRPAGTYAKKIYQRLLIDLSWNSSRLEGNTYSLLETERLLAMGEEAPGKNQVDTQMILNHKEAIEFIVDNSEKLDLNRSSILNIHGLLSHNLLLDPRACGSLRRSPVKISKSVYHPLEVPQLIEEYFRLMVEKAAFIKNPFEQSFFLMVQLPYLQPFLDVNKRVSRLAANIPLIRENLSPLSFTDVPESDYIEGLLAVYELNRIELYRDVFVWAYERSASLYRATLESLGEPDPFRIRYRDLIRNTIYEIVRLKMNKMESSLAIQKFAKEKIPPIDQSRFIEVVEIELYSLHEGNFARFRIRPTEFAEWQKGWI